MPLVQAQKPAAGRQIVVDDVEHLAFDPLGHARSHDGVDTVVYEGQRYRIGAA